MALLFFMLPGENFHEIVRREIAGNYVAYERVAVIHSGGQVVFNVNACDSDELIEIGVFCQKLKADKTNGG